jgi:hypothetical protein
MSEHRTTMRWTRSTYCASANCVEVARASHSVQVRDSKDPEGRRLVLPVEVWREFVERVKRGDLDHT